MRKKYSVIWKLSDEKFIELIKNSFRWRDVLDYFNLKNKGGNSKTVKCRIQSLNLDTNHFFNRTSSSNFTRVISKEEFLSRLVKDSKQSRTNTKAGLIKFKIIDYICSHCGNDGNWNNKKLSLQLEHVNGISNDDRIENLCFLCPNCHSQTSTYAGKSHKKIKIKIEKQRKTKIEWPNKEELYNMVWLEPTSKISKKLGVSDNAIQKRCKKYGITKPPRGYWTKKNCV